MDVVLMFEYLIPVCVVVFLVRAIFRMRYPRAVGSDAWFHLHVAEEISRNKHRMPKTIDGFIIQTPFDYPPLVHFFLSFLSKKNRERFEPFFGPTVDTLQALVLFLLTFSLTGSYIAAFLAGILFAFFPMLVKADARVFFLSPRPFGELFLSLAIIFSLFFVWFGNLPSMILAMFCLSFVFLSSKFALQAGLFLYIIMAFSLLQLNFLLILLGGVVFATIVSKGHFVKLLLGHIRHSSYFNRIGIHRHSWTRQVTGIGKIKAAFETSQLSAKGIAVALLKNPVINAIAYSPLLLVLVVLLVTRFYALVGNPYLYSLLSWSIASFVIVLMTSLRDLKYLGEAERYMEYGVIPLCALVSIVVMDINSSFLWAFLLLVLVYSVLFIMVNYRHAVIEFVERPGDPRHEHELLEQLNKIPKSRILGVPVTPSHKLAYLTQHQSLYWGGNIPLEPFSTQDFILIFKDEYPFPNPNLDVLIKRFGIDLILVSKRSLDRAPPGYHYDFSRYVKEFENPSYALYKVSHSVR